MFGLQRYFIACGSIFFVFVAISCVFGQSQSREYSAYFRAPQLKRIKLTYDPVENVPGGLNTRGDTFVRDENKWRLGCASFDIVKKIAGYDKCEVSLTDQFLYAYFDHDSKPSTVIGTFRTPTDLSFFQNVRASLPLQSGFMFPSDNGTFEKFLTESVVDVQLITADHVHLACRKGAVNADFDMIRQDGFWIFSSYEWVSGEIKIDFSDIQYKNIEGFPVVSEYISSISNVSRPEFDSIRKLRLREASLKPKEQDFWIEDLPNGTPVQTSDIPVLCIYKDGRIVINERLAKDDSLRGTRYASGLQWIQIGSVAITFLLIGVWIYLRNKKNIAT